MWKGLDPFNQWVKMYHNYNEPLLYNSPQGMACIFIYKSVTSQNCHFIPFYNISLK